MRAKDIENNETLYNTLLRYYMDELLSETYYFDILSSPNQKARICEYLAAWADWDRLELPSNFEFCGGKPKAGE